MKKEIAAKWIAALESGDYKQGREKLRRGDEFCCLGVLCDVFNKETGNGGWKKTFGSDADSVRYEFLNAETVLPNDVANWAGMTSGQGDYSYEKCLAADNDAGMEFSDIVKTIKEKVDKL